MTDQSENGLMGSTFQELRHLKPLLGAELARVTTSQAELEQFCDYLRQRLRRALNAGLTVDDVGVELRLSRDFIRRLVDTDQRPAMELTWKTPAPA